MTSEARGAASAAPRATPLTIVSDAVAGDDLEHVAESAAKALTCPVAIAVPSHGAPVVKPPGSLAAEDVAAIAQYARSVVTGADGVVPGAIGDAVPIRIGREVVGIVSTGPGPSRPDRRSWLDAVAAAAAVAAIVPTLDEVGGEAFREAELLAELAADAASAVGGQEDTYRLLIGVLLRDPRELEQLRDSTVAKLVSYDAAHDTDLVNTLQAFLAHHGSTTDTAVALGLHRHTVGYRLSRVEEVSGLSPYESEGRERLSLGLKARRIIEARKRMYKTEVGSRLPNE